jgi:hypothetical protein
MRTVLFDLSMVFWKVISGFIRKQILSFLILVSFNKTMNLLLTVVQQNCASMVNEILCD